ncbi:MAG: response regulator [Clostridia bacterium]|nr:response regulator [Clostridia bacterium]
MENKIKVLIADDNVPYTETIKNYLEENFNIEVVGISNTNEEEVEMIDKLKPKIVITDLKRKDKYIGEEVIKKYSNDANSPKFFIISADMRMELVREYDNVVDYIMKPIDYDRLSEKIKNIIEEI